MCIGGSNGKIWIKPCVTMLSRMLADRSEYIGGGRSLILLMTSTILFSVFCIMAPQD